ncbi:hypothetical protein HUJ05_001061 [Dendroctonus ponderosae]|nr:hypothetical protein HUJ05_001061 [Dendroctonus ponderosae]
MAPPPPPHDPHGPQEPPHDPHGPQEHPHDPHGPRRPLGGPGPGPHGHEGNSTRIKVDRKTKNDIPISQGIRQGDSLSPFLFTLIMDEIIEEISGLRMGYGINGKPICIICYADDATILAETEDYLQRQLHKFNQGTNEM